MPRRWTIHDIWDEDRDPALLRVREAQAQRDAPAAPEQPPVPEVAATPTLEATEAEVAELTARLRAGDVGVRERLMRLLERLR